MLRRRDGIDKMQPGIFNLLHKIGGGKLYHCWFCRLQFYDVRQRFDGKSERKLLDVPKRQASEPDDADLKAAS